MSPAQLAVKVRQHPDVLLMCDYDGTLVPLADRPELARPTPRLLNLLKQLVSRPGLHLAIISGRRLTDLLDLLPIPGLYLAGLHGLEIACPAGQVIRLLPAGQKEIPWEEISTLVGEVAAGNPGMFVENKGEAIALHYRLADPRRAAAALEQLRRDLAPFLEAGLELLPGHKVLEVRRRGVHKGLAVKYFTARWPGTWSIFFGDDRTDEDAFAALPPGSLAIRIGPQAPSQADYFWPSPASFTRFLELLTSS